MGMPEGQAVVIGQNAALGEVLLGTITAGSAWDAALRETLPAALRRWSTDPETYAVAMTAGSASRLDAIAEPVVAGTGDLDEALAAATRLAWQLECFTKPTVSLIDGVLSDASAGLALPGTHPVAGEGFAFCCDAAAMGQLPHAWAAQRLARLPGEAGIYLTLTGVSIGRADAYGLGLVTHCIDAPHFAAIRAGLATADPVDPLLDGLHADPGPMPMQTIAPAIARSFGADSITAILERLAAERGEHAAWADATRDRLAARSPLALAATLALLRRIGGLDKRHGLEVAHRSHLAMTRRRDFQTALAARLKAGAGHPSWQPARLADVEPDMVAAILDDPQVPALSLPPRPEVVIAQ
jgi:enoyl-CoA hydratase